MASFNCRVKRQKRSATGLAVKVQKDRHSRRVSDQKRFSPDRREAGQTRVGSTAVQAVRHTNTHTHTHAVTEQVAFEARQSLRPARGSGREVGGGSEGWLRRRKSLLGARHDPVRGETVRSWGRPKRRRAELEGYLERLGPREISTTSDPRLRARRGEEEV